MSADDVRGRVEAFVADLEARGFELRYSASPDGLRFSVDVRLPAAAVPVGVEVVAAQPMPPEWNGTPPSASLDPPADRP